LQQRLWSLDRSLGFPSIGDPKPSLLSILLPCYSFFRKQTGHLISTQSNANFQKRLIATRKL